MRSTNGSSVNWSWTRSVYVSSDSKRNTTAVTPERPCVPQLSLRQHLTHPNSASRCAPVERCKARDEGEQDNVPLRTGWVDRNAQALVWTNTVGSPILGSGKIAESQQASEKSMKYFINAYYFFMIGSCCFQKIL